MLRIVSVPAEGPPRPQDLAEAVAVVRSGALLIYPTDTLYALGGSALDAAAARRVRDAKGRDDAKPLPLVAADRGQADLLVASWPPVAERLALRFWPGPLTLVLPAAPTVPKEVTAGSGSVALRVPGLAVTRALCAEAGPLVSTSANLAGGPPPVTCAEAVAAVGGAAGLAWDAGPGRSAGSTILDLTATPPRLLRAGPIPWEEIAVSISGPAC